MTWRSFCIAARYFLFHISIDRDDDRPMPGRPRLLHRQILALPLLATVACAGVASPVAGPDPGPTLEPVAWTAAVAFAQDDLASQAVTNASVRMVLRPTLGGHELRLRLENRYGTAPAAFGGVSVGVREAGASVVAGSLRRVTFGGEIAVTVPAGGRVTSDPVALDVEADADLAVTLYVPGEGVRASGHTQAFTTSYRTADGAGDATGDEEAQRFVRTTTRMDWVAGIDVLAAAAGAVVALGSSSTDGNGSTLDGHDRWTDLLARRLSPLPPDLRKGMVNAGIGGNTLLAWPSVPGTGPPGLERLDADALDLANVTHLILFHGSNDIARGASAEQVIAGLQAAVDRARARGVAVVGATIGPRSYPDPEPMHAVRHAVNEWILRGGAYDGVLDFDAVLRDPANPDRLAPDYDSGDHLHPNPDGYAAMADSIDLALFGGAAVTLHLGDAP